MPGPFPPTFSDGRNRLAAIVTGVLGIGTLVRLAVYVVSSDLRAGRGLDLALEAVGLVSERYLAFERRYRGAVDGREVEVTSLPGYGVRSPQLDLSVAAALGFRMAGGYGCACALTRWPESRFSAASTISWPWRRRGGGRWAADPACSRRAVALDLLTRASASDVSAADAHNTLWQD